MQAVGANIISNIFSEDETPLSLTTPSDFFSFYIKYLWGQTFDSKEELMENVNIFS